MKCKLWKEVRVNDVVSEKSTRVSDPSKSSYEKFIGLEHFNAGRLEICRFGTTNNLGSSMKICQSGDTLIARRNVYLKRASVSNEDALCSGDAIVLKEKELVISGFLPILFNSDSFWVYALSNADGTMSKRLNVAHLMKYRFLLPPQSEQKQIVKVVWDLEKLIHTLNDKNSLLDEMIKSRFIEMFGTVNNNQNEYSVVTIESCCEILDSQRIPITSTDREPGPYPYYGANGVQDFVKDYLFDDNLVLLAEDGGHFNEIGKVAYSVSGKCWINNHAHVLKPHNDLNIEYLENALNFTDLSSEVNGTTRQKLTQASMRKIKILGPPIKLQNQFADFVKQVDKSKFELRQQIENTIVLQKTIINKVVRGLSNV